MSIPHTFLKFVPFERKDILENGMIRLPPRKDLNDPFELLPTISHLTNESINSQLLSSDLLSAESMTQEDYDFSIQRYNLTPTISKRYEKYVDSMGILSLSASAQMSQNPGNGFVRPNDPRMNLTMWSHYAESHTGFIIEFRADLFGDQEINNVRYTDQREILSFEDVERKDTSIFYEKSTHWNYEKEWRIIRPLSEASKIVSVDGKEIHLFEFNKASVVSVTFGCRTTESNQSKIIELIRSDDGYENVVINYTDISKYKYELEFSHEILVDGSSYSNRHTVMENIEEEKKPRCKKNLVKE